MTLHETTMCQIVGCLLAASLLSPLAASAVPIAVTNPSFEDPNAGGSFVVGVPTGWTDNGSVVAYVEDCGAVGFASCDINQYSGNDGGGIYQDLGVAWQPNTTYTMDLATAHRSGFTHSSLDFGFYDSGAIGTNLGTAGSADIQGVWSGSGNPDGDDQFNLMRDASLLATIGSGALGNVATFTTGAVVPGGNVVVYLSNAGGSRVNFDNVRVDATPIPEPATIAMATVFGMMAFRRRG